MMKSMVDPSVRIGYAYDQRVIAIMAYYIINIPFIFTIKVIITS